jgi:polysaccharide export outer membrane protein
MRIFLAFLLLLGFWGEARAQSESALNRGDTIAIQVFQDPKLDRQMIIGPSGMISFPLVGQVRAAGQTPQQLADLLKSRLRDKYTTELDITVSLVSLGREADETRPRFFVSGEVRTPGSYPIRVKTSLVQGIALAGGLGPFAAKQRIQVRRKINGVESLFTFNYSAFEAGTNLTGNIDLQQGDVIIVPERGLFE